MKRLALLALGLLLGACGESTGPRVGGHTHWLSACKNDTDCGDQLLCRCDFCVVPCGTPDTACTAPIAGTSCFAADSAAAATLCDGAVAPEPLCLLPCTSDAECGGDRCASGACVPSVGTGGTAGTGGGANVGGTAGAGGTGATGATGTLCGVEICASGQVCCGPVECGTCIPEMSGQFCPDTCPTGTGGTGGVCPTSYVVPDLDRTCTTAADCFLGAHWADCCGSQVAVSFANSELTAFTAVEAACGPACTCAGSPPLAEDGAQLASVTAAISECIDGQCLARGPEYAGTCLTSDVCINTNAEGECIDAPGPQGAGICRGAAGLCFYCECAAPDTPIATPSGERPIAELRVGDLVYSVENEAIVVVPIARVNRRRVEAHRVVEVRLETGARLHISPGHPPADGRTFADLRAGGELDGQRVVATRVVPYTHSHTYDILPASSTGTYFAAGALIGSTLRQASGP